MSPTDVIEDGKFDGLEIRRIPRIRGVGVFATRKFSANDIVVRYMGTTLTPQQGRVIEAERKDVRPDVCLYSFLPV